MAQSIEKKYYKIGEVAEILGIPASTLRFWETKFTIIKPKRNDKGSRFYTPNDVEDIRMIYFLVKERGLHLDAAQAEIKRNRHGVSRRFDAIQRLREIRARVTRMIDALEEPSSSAT